MPSNGVFVREHIRAAARHHDCLAWAYYDHPTFKVQQFAVERTDEFGIPTIRVRLPHGSIPKLRYFQRLMKLQRFGARLVRGEFPPDIIHAHTFHAGVVGTLLSRRTGAPLVLTEHWSGFQQGLLTRMDKLKLKFALRHSAIVLPVSEFLAGILRNYGVPARFTVVPNVVDTEVFRPPAEPPPPAATELKLLAVSSLTPRKGIPLMLQAMRRLKGEGVNFHLTIDGDGPLRAGSEQLAVELGLQDRVTFLGWLPTKNDIADLMRSHHIFVHSASDETFSVVTAEAACCGLPVVAFDIPPLPERVHAGGGLLVKPGDADALAAGIRQVAANLDRYDRAKIAAAADRYSLDAVGEQLNGIYREVVSAALSPEG